MNLRLNQSTLVAAYDERCGVCQKFARTVTLLGGRGVVLPTGARNPSIAALQQVPLTQRLEALHAAEVGANGETRRILVGFDAVAAIIAQTHLAVPARPLVALLKLTGMGDWLYKRVAAGPWRARCADGSCPI